MPEWSNGQDLGSCGLVPTQVRILFPAYFKMEIIKKTYSEPFEKILSGDKKFDVRLNDFEVTDGDILVLKEINEKREFTGREMKSNLRFKNKKCEMVE